jgi:endonuclease/exonuclease/phosphatase family metal-dependent hydrolase
VSDVAPSNLIQTRLRVLTWNVWWRFGPWEAREPAIVATLAGVDADVIALQECWAEVGGRNQAEILANDLGLHHAYANCVDDGHLAFGNAILSRWPMSETEIRRLPSFPGVDELRVVLKAVVDGPRGPIDVYTTHLNWRYDESHVRQVQVKALAELIAESRGRTFPAVLCGDFNADWWSDEVRMLTGRAPVPVPRLVFFDAWEVAGDGPGHTWSNENPFAVGDLEPDRRIDYVFVGWPKARGAGHVVAARVEGVEPVNGIHPSDHYAVLAELRY